MSKKINVKLIPAYSFVSTLINVDKRVLRILGKINNFAKLIHIIEFLFLG